MDDRMHDDRGRADRLSSDDAAPRLRAIAYVSSASWSLLDDDLATIVSDSRGHNLDADITGVLLYCDGNFMQYLEGPDDAIAAAWARIRRSEHHHAIGELLDEPIARREFGDWTLGFSRIGPAAFLAEARTAANDGADAGDAVVATSRPDVVLGPGAELLNLFWKNCTTRRLG